MSDLISRQQAIDAVVGCTNCGTEDVLRAYVTKHSLENGWTGGIVDALDAIEQLPSAQPEHCGDAVSRNAIIQKLNQMDRYVSAELRLCDTDKKFPQNEVFIVDDVYEEIVEQLPSAQPEHRDALEKAVAVEAISDELMSRFDISATYAYEVAESAVNRIEEMAKEMGKR